MRVIAAQMGYALCAELYADITGFCVPDDVANSAKDKGL